MKILVAVPTLQVGGSEKYAIELSNEFSLQGNEVNLLITNSKKISFLKNLVSPKVNLIINECSSKVEVLLKNRKLIRKINPDASFIFMNSMLHGYFGFRSIKSPKYLSITSKADRFFSGKLHVYLVKRAIRKYQLEIISPSDLIKESLLEYANINSKHILPNAINTKPFVNYLSKNKRDNNIIEFVAIGRLVDVKNHDFLLDVWKELIKKTQNVHLRIIGDGNLKERLHEKIIKLGLEDYVSLMGQRDDVVELLNDSDVYVMTSVSEGQGLSNVEAMACKLPVVMTNAIGNEFLVKNNGYLVEQGDVNTFVKHCYDLSNDSEKRKIFGEESLKIALQYDISVIAKRHTDLILS